MPAADGRTPRRAGVRDAARLVVLRAEMLRAMGRVGTEDEEWRGVARDWFTTRLDDDRRFAAFVVEDPHGVLVSGAAGAVQEHAPSPGDRAGFHGHVFNVVTLPAHRRRGLGRAVVTALLQWYDSDTPVRVTDLTATTEGESLYRSLGFVRHGFQTLRRTSAEGAL